MDCEHRRHMAGMIEQLIAFEGNCAQCEVDTKQDQSYTVVFTR